ncbi:hypothetical protein V491_07378 [Pseudogymnoascus sp. VKM F-3775]|nr:hypothetical protein V491_07378 [Pseudogymnoascus sp. VKM F-3775]
MANRNQSFTLQAPPKSPSSSPLPALDDEHAKHIAMQLIATELRQLPIRSIPRALYSGRSLNILHKLWGARLCAGMEDGSVQDALKIVHGQIPDEDHELLCRGAWHFQANDMRILSPQWEQFFRFAFKEPNIEEYYIFRQIARNWSSESNGKKTDREIAKAWQHMFFAIGESLKHQLQKMNYHLCFCRIPQPHSVTALQKSIQFFHDSEENKAEKRVAQAVSACTALIVFDFIIEEGGEESKHTRNGSHQDVRSAIRSLESARLSDKNQHDLSNIIAYLNKKLILDMPTELWVVIFRMLQYGDPQKALKDQQSLIHTHPILARKLGNESLFQRRMLAVKTATTSWDAILPHSGQQPSVSRQQLVGLIKIFGLVSSKRRERFIDAILEQDENGQSETIRTLALETEFGNLHPQQRKLIIDAMLQIKSEAVLVYAIQAVLRWIKYIDLRQEVDGESFRRLVDAAMLRIKHPNGQTIVLSELGKVLDYLSQDQINRVFEAILALGNAWVFVALKIRCLNEGQRTRFLDAVLRLEDDIERAWVLSVI